MKSSRSVDMKMSRESFSEDSLSRASNHGRADTRRLTRHERGRMVARTPEQLAWAYIVINPSLHLRLTIVDRSAMAGGRYIAFATTADRGCDIAQPGKRFPA